MDKFTCKVKHSVICIQEEPETKALKLGDEYTVIEAYRPQFSTVVYVKLKEIPDRSFEFNRYFVAKELSN